MPFFFSCYGVLSVNLIPGSTPYWGCHMNRGTKKMPLVKDAVHDLATDTVVTSAATKWGMGGGTIAATFGWLTSNGVAVAIGILVTVLGFVINYIFQRRRDRREVEQKAFDRQLALAEEKRRQELHEAQLRAIHDKCNIQ